MAVNIELINLDMSKERLNDIDRALASEGLSYHRQKAIKGTDVLFYHKQTNKMFTGAELGSTSTTQLETYNKYLVICDPKSVSPTSFAFNGFSLSAGQIGLLCSNVIIWSNADAKDYQNTLILQDNKVPVAGFAEKLNNIMDSVPSTYDIVFLTVNQTSGGQIPVEGNEYLNTFTSDAYWKGAAAVILSNKAIKTLLQDYEAPFNVPADVYYHKFAVCADRKLFCAVLPKTTTGKMEVYVAADDSLFYDHDTISVTETMGVVKDVEI